MVQQSRRLVEDYVLYKIHSAFPAKTRIQDKTYVNHEDVKDLTRVLPLPQQVPSRLSLSLRNIAVQYEEKYKQTFPTLFEEIRSTDLSPNEVDHIFSKITQDLFQLPLKQSFVSRTGIQNGKIETRLHEKYASVQSVNEDNSHIKWGHLVALLAFAGILAVRAVECRSPEVVDSIVSWVTKFFDTELSQWLAQQGGWENFTEWSKASETRIEYPSDNDYDGVGCGTGIRSVMRVGVIAACVGLGAFLMSKK